jgi:cytoskeleton protein RodZ
MNETKTSDVVAENLSIEATYQAIGSLLHEKRIAAGLSQADVADKIKLSARQINALEQGRYEELPGHVFIRGFVRSYARALGLDIAPLLAKLNEVVPETQTRLPDLHEEKTAIHSGYHHRRRMQWILFIIVVLLILIAIGGAGMRYLMHEGESTHDTEIGISSAPLTSEGPMGFEASYMAQMPPMTTTANTASFTNASESTSIQAGPGVLVAPPSASVIPAVNTLQIHATQDSWVQVVDGNNDTLSQGIIKANTTQHLRGQIPYRVKIGNAPHTTLIYDDKTIDLAPFTHGNIARLDIP